MEARTPSARLSISRVIASSVSDSGAPRAMSSKMRMWPVARSWWGSVISVVRDADSDEAALDRLGHDAGARPHRQLGPDLLQAVLDCVRTQVDARGDVLDREPFREIAHDVDLRLGEERRRLHHRRPRGACPSAATARA